MKCSAALGDAETAGPGYARDASGVCMRWFSALPLMWAISAPAWAGLKVVGTPKVSFAATGTVMDMEGVGTTLTVADDGTTVTFTVPMKTVSTDNSLRDDHMHNTYLEVGKFPDVVVAVPKAEFKLPAAPGDKLKGSVTGTFTAHGVTQPVKVNYAAKRGDAGTKVEATFDFDVSKHGIAIPSYLGVTLDPKMKGAATVELVDG